MKISYLSMLLCRKIGYDFPDPSGYFWILGSSAANLWLLSDSHDRDHAHREAVAVDAALFALHVWSPTDFDGANPWEVKIGRTVTENVIPDDLLRWKTRKILTIHAARFHLPKEMHGRIS